MAKSKRVPARRQTRKQGSFSIVEWMSLQDTGNHIKKALGLDCALVIAELTAKIVSGNLQVLDRYIKPDGTIDRLLPADFFKLDSQGAAYRIACVGGALKVTLVHPADSLRGIEHLGESLTLTLESLGHHFFFRREKVLALWPVPGKASEAPPVPMKGRGGAPPEYDWDAITVWVSGRFYEEGVSELNKPNITKLANRARTWCEGHFGKAPSIDNMRKHVRKLMAAYWRAQPKK